ncbi:MAG TPA: hypothetical protein VE134_04865 [Methanomicrobiales archaeon]|nr:hypothetical protein [Methanomicrobiales archaeon]
MQKQVAGSPRDTTCANTESQGTANNPLPSRKISPAADPAGLKEPVPLYLIPQALSQEIHRLRDAILEVRIRRTAGHNYKITVKTAKGRRE